MQETMIVNVTAQMLRDQRDWDEYQRSSSSHILCYPGSVTDGEAADLSVRSVKVTLLIYLWHFSEIFQSNDLVWESNLLFSYSKTVS